MGCGSKAFWDRSWGSADPAMISAYIENYNTDEDAIIGFLKGHGVRRVCDAGCGCGAYSLRLSRQGFSVSGFDIAGKAVSMAKKLLLDNGYPAESFRQADILSTGCADRSFDAVIARDVVDHLPVTDGICAVKELLRIVRPGGWVVITLDTADGYESEPHEINEDGDWLFSQGKWAGMVFHPYYFDEFSNLNTGIDCTLLYSDERGLAIAIEK